MDTQLCILIKYVYSLNYVIDFKWYQFKFVGISFPMRLFFTKISILRFPYMLNLEDDKGSN